MQLLILNDLKGSITPCLPAVFDDADRVSLARGIRALKRERKPQNKKTAARLPQTRFPAGHNLNRVAVFAKRHNFSLLLNR